MDAGKAAKLAAQQARVLQRFADPFWRFAHLYWVKDEYGVAVRFRPRPAQVKVLEAVYRDKRRKIIIPKARQLGISTVAALIILDLMLFKAGTQAAVVDMTQLDATKKLKGKIKFAFDRLPRALRACYRVVNASGKVLTIELRRPNDTLREVQAGMNARGDTFQIMHISEWGKIAFRDPSRDDEIYTGALAAAKVGIVIVETTWKGGKVGRLWELTDRALKVRPEHRTVEDYTVFFCAWWEDAVYSLEGDARQIDRGCRKYLGEVEAEIGHKLSAGQRLWYYKVAWEKGLMRFEEYPSTLSECFRAPIEGAIYAEWLEKVRARGGMAGFDPDPAVPVGTCWDRGSPLNMVTWYFQLVGSGPDGRDEIRLLDCDMDLDITPAERIEHMREKLGAWGRELGAELRFGFHYLPHDALVKDNAGRTFLADFEEAGLVNARIVPRTADVWIGINRVRALMPRLRFRTPACQKGLNSLEAYRQGIWIEGKRAVDVPVHDKASHAADALRTMAEADLAGLLEAGHVGAVFDKAGLAALKGGK